ncbi:MAG: hypothetical protein AB1765_03975 [Candidatus Hydrogenedentota bacterium]
MPYLSTIVFGIICQVSQIIIIRELLVIFYGSEFTIGIIFCFWMLWSGAGSLIAGYLIKKIGAPHKFLFITSIIYVLVLPLTITAIRFSRMFLDISTGQIISLSQTLSLSFILLSFNSFILGLLFVVFTRVLSEQKEGAHTPSVVYIFEAFGSCAGGLLFSLFFVKFLNHYVIISLLNIFLLLVLNRLYNKTIKKLNYISIFFFLIFFLFSSRVNTIVNIFQWEKSFAGFKLVEVCDSKYSRLSVLKNQNQFNIYANSSLLFFVVSKEDDRYGIEEIDYINFTNTALTQHNNPQKILLVGGGLKGVIRELSKTKSYSIDYIETDPSLLSTVKKYVPQRTREVLILPNVRVINQDARLYIKGCSEKYDLIILSVPEPSNFLNNRFYTKEFFLETKNILNKDGVLVSGLVSIQNVTEEMSINRNASIYHTLKSVFNNVLFAGENFLYFFASDSDNQLSADPFVLSNRYINRGVSSDIFSEFYFYNLFNEDSVKRINWILFNHGKNKDSVFSPTIIPPSLTYPELTELKKVSYYVEEKYFINFDFKPITYFYNIIIWDEISKQFSKSKNILFKLFLKINLNILLICIMMLLLLPNVFFKCKRSFNTQHKKYGVFLSIFTTGFSTMLFQISLIYSFQSIYGFVYEFIGLITAMFMLGLGSGSFLALKFITKKDNLKLLGIIESSVFIFSLIMIYLINLSAEISSTNVIFIIFLLLTFIAGIIDGLDFPVAISCYYTIIKDTLKSSGLIYGIELIGGCSGSIIASIILIPIKGILFTCFIAGLVNLIAAITVFFIKEQK